MPNIYPNSQPQPYYGVNGKLTDDAKALPVPKKVFILDKSVLLYSPYAVFAFDEHTVTIPFNVIRDLDAIKKSQGESSRNAQEALSIIETLREKGNLRCGVPLENGGMFFVDDSSNETLLESAYSCMRHCPKESEIIVVSNSIATRIRMEESGFKAEVYRSDSVMTDTPYLGRTTAHCYDTEIDASGIPNEIPVSAVETDESLVENEFVTVKRADDSTIGVYQAKGKKLVRLNMDKMYPYGVRPKNLGQKMAIHALMDSLQSSSLTILMGAAVTAFGKFGLLDFSVPKGNEIVNYPTSESKLTKEQLLQEAASEKDIPASIQAIKVQEDRIDFIAKWDGLRPSQSETFKKMIFVQDDFTYRELDYEYGEMIGLGDAGPNPSGTTIGKVQKRKIIYRKSQNGSITREVIDTTNITNDIHKWLADRGYSKVG